MQVIKQNKNLFLIPIALLVGTTALSACTPTVSQRGNMLENYQIEEIKVNESKRSDVLRTLGSPTTKSTFDPKVWYYIGQETEKRGIFDPKVTKERIFLVAFNDEGTLTDIEEIDRKRLNIPYVRDKTITHGNERTLAQELLGNLGKFNPQQNSSAATTGGGI
ncbi:MAG: outer membrane protein assembly factor BamE [Alphaproteobacteria bacterium]|nr:outer membrane protein assembly factor BamE [Alphaproteobacteria bacterium]